MTDIALVWDAASFSADIALLGADLATDDGLRTAVIISLFTDARAADDDILPQDGADRRGWWGDIAPDVEGDQIGSKLWLLKREKNLPSVVNRARDYAAQALAWLTEDGVASSVQVEAEAIRLADQTYALAIGVVIDRPNGPARQRYDFVWKATS